MTTPDRRFLLKDNFLAGKPKFPAKGKSSCSSLWKLIGPKTDLAFRVWTSEEASVARSSAEASFCRSSSELSSAGRSCDLSSSASAEAADVARLGHLFMLPVAMSSMILHTNI